MLKGSRKVKTIILLSMLILVLLAVSACSNSQKTSSQNPAIPSDAAKLRVAVSIVPQTTFVKAVGGDMVEVVTMIPPGASPENYAPSPQIMEQLSDAKLYFSIAVPAEKNGILPRLQEANSQMKVVDLAAKVDQIYPAREMAPGESDPHRWLSPKRVKEMIKIIAAELTALDPQNAASYQKNALAYQGELDKLDKDISSSLGKVTGQSFIVYHPAMGYFADDYGLKMIALEEEGKEATVQDFQAVIDQAKKEKIKVVFYQAEMDSKQARTLAQELGGEAQLIAPLAPDYINNLRKTASTFAQVMQQQ
ncbi:MAG: zinc ABC transporter substrate-binding protein [Syntrophomonas sp.]|uniref:metal ABC transporter solute-binding protein, Zn/Mn family n=1 Tax=Syntrophomonas sp. TaxID=2053627 RepID=UPI002608C4C4|nr:zinc ABC transporter substrate-binding protein [Syntrophomonas sp.]MDD2510929.1 zinc ABC transporter substrate-binding protein [Syntrophomonas sp.]MDD4626893.1 zinc ABC transporter substrate-binding protein [Syntrophomonas sp.]